MHDGGSGTSRFAYVPVDPDLVSAVRRRAAFLWGRPPEILAVAPGRIEIVGNHLDYNGGEVVAAAIDRWVVVAGRRRADLRLRLAASDIARGTASVSMSAAQSFDRRQRGGEPGWDDFAQAAVAALAAEGVTLPGADLHYRGTIPIGVGLSSSAALLVALVAALLRLAGADRPPLEIARIAMLAEHRAGVPVGLLDQTASVTGGVLRFSNDPDRVRPLESNLGDAVFAICDSGVRHTLSGTRYPLRVAECRDALVRLRAAGFEIESLAQLPARDLDRAAALLPAPLDARVRHVVGEVERTRLAERALEAGNSQALGALMNASGHSSATLYDISHPAVERVVAMAREIPGVWGARMMGGGDGGSALVLAQPAALERLRERLPEGAVTVCRIARGLRVEARD